MWNLGKYQRDSVLAELVSGGKLRLSLLLNNHLTIVSNMKCDTFFQVKVCDVTI